MRTYYDDEMCRDCNKANVADCKTGRCRSCQDKADKRNARARRNRAAMNAALDSVGMRRVRGAVGGVYYE